MRRVCARIHPPAPSSDAVSRTTAAVPGRGAIATAPAGTLPVRNVKRAPRSASGPDGGNSRSDSLSPSVSEVEYASASYTATCGAGTTTTSCHPNCRG